MSSKRTNGLLVTALAALALAATATAGTVREGDGSEVKADAATAPTGYYEQGVQPPIQPEPPHEPPAPEPQPGPSAPPPEEKPQIVVCDCDELEVDARPENAYYQTRSGRRGQSIIFRGTLFCEPGDISLCWSSFTIRKKSAAGEIRAPLGRGKILNQPIRCAGDCGQKVTAERKLWIVISTTQTVKVELEVEKGPCGDKGPSKAVFTFTFKKGRLASIDRSEWQPIPPA